MAPEPSAAPPHVVDAAPGEDDCAGGGAGAAGGGRGGGAKGKGKGKGPRPPPSQGEAEKARLLRAEQLERDKKERAEAQDRQRQAQRASDELRLRLPSMRPHDIDDVPWADIECSVHLEGGRGTSGWCPKGGVIVLQVGDDGAVCSRRGASLPSELVAWRVASALGIRAPRLRLLQFGADEEFDAVLAAEERSRPSNGVDEYWAKLRVDQPEAYEHARREERRLLGMVAVMEFVPGVQLDCAAQLVAAAGAELLQEIGRLGALDLLLNNMDRLPLPVWGNGVGNFGNAIVVGGGADVVGIDQQVLAIEDEAGMERYLDGVRRFLSCLMGTGPPREDGEFSVAALRERLRGAFFHWCHVELPEASVESLLEGLRGGVRAANEASSSGRLQAALDAVEQELAARGVDDAPRLTAFVRRVAREIEEAAAVGGDAGRGALEV